MFVLRSLIQGQQSQGNKVQGVRSICRRIKTLVRLYVTACRSLYSLHSPSVHPLFIPSLCLFTVLLSILHSSPHSVYLQSFCPSFIHPLTLSIYTHFYPSFIHLSRITLFIYIPSLHPSFILSLCLFAVLLSILHLSPHSVYLQRF